MGVSRNLSDQMHSAREELVKVSAEKEDLQKKVRSVCSEFIGLLMATFENWE